MSKRKSVCVHAMRIILVVLRVLLVVLSVKEVKSLQPELANLEEREALKRVQ